MALELLDTPPFRPVPRDGSAFAARLARVDRSVQAKLGGVPVVYAPAIGHPVTVTGIFEASYVLVQGDPIAGVEAGVPAVFVLLQDLPTDPEQDDPLITVGGILYRVFERRPDGMGGVTLALRLDV